MGFEIDWNVPRPDLSAFEAGWSRSRVVTIPPRQGLIEVERALAASHDNGGARVAQFRLVEPDPAVAWVMARNRLAEFGVFERLLAHPAVLAAVPEAVGAEGVRDAFAMEGSFMAFGRVAQALAQGGAYRQAVVPDAEAWRLTDAFISDAIGSRVRESFAWISWKAWSPWFFDIAWDATFFWFDPLDGVVTLLLVTDTD